MLQTAASAATTPGLPREAPIYRMRARTDNAAPHAHTRGTQGYTFVIGEGVTTSKLSCVQETEGIEGVTNV